MSIKLRNAIFQLDPKDPLWVYFDPEDRGYSVAGIECSKCYTKKNVVPRLDSFGNQTIESCDTCYNFHIRPMLMQMIKNIQGEDALDAWMLLSDKEQALIRAKKLGWERSALDFFEKHMKACPYCGINCTCWEDYMREREEYQDDEYLSYDLDAFGSEGYGGDW